MLQLEGHKQYYIDNAVSYLQSLKDILHGIKTNIFGKNLTDRQIHVLNPLVTNLEGAQLFAFNTIRSRIDNRRIQLNDPHLSRSISSQPILILGKPGSGKTYLLNACIEYCMENGHTVSVATPTGCLACMYKSALPDSVTCETIHSMFQYPVKEAEHPSVNWYLANIDVIVLDEISQVSIPIFQHILNTIQVLHLKPLLIACGDFAQQQPLSTIDGKVHQVPNIASDPQLLSIFRTLRLTQQYRITDHVLLNFLSHIRYNKPTEQQLQSFQEGKVLFFTQVDKSAIVKAHLSNTNAIF